MTTLIYPPAEVCPASSVNMPINIEHVRALRRLTLVADNKPGIQFHFNGPGASIEWAFLTEEDRDTAWMQIMTSWGEPIG